MIMLTVHNPAIQACLYPQTKIFIQLNIKYIEECNTSYHIS